MESELKSPHAHKVIKFNAKAHITRRLYVELLIYILFTYITLRTYILLEHNVK